MSVTLSKNEKLTTWEREVLADATDEPIRDVTADEDASLSEYEGEELPLAHADYPHEPGRLLDCVACEAECWCTGRPGDTQCVFCESLGSGD